MVRQILSTKIYIPPARPGVVKRSRLIKNLNEGIQHKLTLISAPAGFGKTTLVSEWIVNCGHQAAWLSLDEGDKEPIQFVTYFAAALQPFAPQLGDQMMDLQQSSQPPPIDSVLTTLVNEIATIEQDFVLVLDDYHTLDSPPVDSAVRFLVENQPPQMHLVIVTREDPLLPLPRLRARGQLTELRGADLRFTPDEATAFLNHVMGLNLLPEDVRVLETRTEGWIAGLQLAALSMQGRGDKREFIKAFAGDHRYIVDYLVQEVLKHQPDHVRSFLLRTAILNRLSGSLCDALTGQEDGSAMLERMEHGNLFVIPLDDNRLWFRYHHLFADVLRAHLMDEQPDLVPLLHQRASEWYAKNDLLPEAIHHSLTAPDYEQAAALVEMAWPALFKGFRPATWLGWVKALPDELVRIRPVLNLGCTWTLLHDGDLEGAESHLHNAEQWLDTASGQPAMPEMVIVNEDALQSLPALLANARIYLSQAQGRVRVAVKHARHTLDILPMDDHYHRGLAELFLGLAYWAGGNLELACQSIADGVDDMRLTKNTYFQVFGTTALADIKMAQGRLHEAASRYTQSLQFEMDQEEFALRRLADRHVGLGEIHRERNDLKAAVKSLQDAKKEMADQAIFPGREFRWHVAMARVKMAAGDTDSAQDLLHTAERLHKQDIVPDIRPATAIKARIWISEGRLTEVESWAQQQGLSVDDELSYVHEFEHITLARLLLAQQKNGVAVKLLNDLLNAAEVEGRIGSVIEILILLALAHAAQGDIDIALVPLERAFALAAPEGYIRIFIDEGQPMVRLLSRGVERGIMPGYARKLLNALDTQSPYSTVSESEPLVEPLSERELEILGLVAQGLSNREISERLFIALDTVKGHNRNLYQKLQVARRTEAIARARELGLI
ncbi:MAG: helix-turn-helix transcriptional regulator [Anaerolineaceae bacterium]|nr:helix-turn-helix transcriptional regulator [Anaerolineaceae bacterium]